MSTKEPSFWKYLTYDEFGMVNGILEDAPKKEKEAYEEYMQEEKKDSHKI